MGVVGIEIFGTLSPGAFNLRLPQAWLDDADHSFGDLILQVEKRPPASRRIWSAQRCAPLSASSNWAVMRTQFPRLANCPLQHIAHTKLSRPTCHTSTALPL